MNEEFHEIGDGVFVRRHASFDLNVGLIVGDGQCLVLDTRMSHREGADLIGAIRKITSDPWTVVNSHAHFDHYFGNAVFMPAEIWSLARCAELIGAHGEETRLRLLDSLPDNRAEIGEVQIVVPDHTFADRATLDIGGRAVHLRYFGRGHTDNDLVTHVPDAGVIFAADLVEEGAPPAMGDAYPLDWPGTLTAMLAELPEQVIVPGHGAVVGRGFVEAQRAELALTAEVARRAHAEGLREHFAGIPFPEEVARLAVERAFLQLDRQ